MNNKKIKLIGLAGITLLSAIMLTGCGNNDVKTYDKEQMNVSANINNFATTNNVEEVVENTFKEKNTTESNTTSDNNATTTKFTKLSFQKEHLDYNEYGILHAYDENGNEVWKYTTGVYPQAQYDVVEYLVNLSYRPAGKNQGYVFINDGGTIVKLDEQTGAVIWKNSDFDGLGARYSCTIDADGTIYIAGAEGPNLCVISEDGKTIKRLGNFPSEEYFGVDEIRNSGDGKIVMHFHGHPKTGEEPDENSSYTAIVEVNTSDYSYKVDYELGYLGDRN